MNVPGSYNLREQCRACARIHTASRHHHSLCKTHATQSCRQNAKGARARERGRLAATFQSRPCHRDFSRPALIPVQHASNAGSIPHNVRERVAKNRLSCALSLQTCEKSLNVTKSRQKCELRDSACYSWATQAKPGYARGSVDYTTGEVGVGYTG